MSLSAAMLVALAAALGAEESPALKRNRRLDVQLAAFTSTPERLVACVGVHPSPAVELDLCAGGGDAALFALTTHAYLRARWSVPIGLGRALAFGLGPGLGARLLAFCPLGTCSVAAGPELLASFEAVEWLTERFGLTAQFDGGAALLWTRGPRGVETMLRASVRLLGGVAF